MPRTLHQDLLPCLQAVFLLLICRPLAAAKADSLLLAPLLRFEAWPQTFQTCNHCADTRINKVDRECCGVCNFPRRCYRKTIRRMVQQLVGQGVDPTELQPADLLDAFAGKTVWFLGDSQMAGFYSAAECFLHPYLTDNVRRPPSDDPELNLALQHIGTGDYRRRAFCVGLRRRTRLCTARRDFLDHIADALPAIASLAPASELLLIVNSGLHYRSPEAFREALAQFAAALAAARPRPSRLLWLDVSAQHFNTTRGLNPHRPVREGGCVPLEPWLDAGDPEMVAGGWPNAIAREAMAAAGVPVVRTFAETAPLWYMHKDPDCIHFCHPGPYQIWLLLLHRALRTL